MMAAHTLKGAVRYFAGEGPFDMAFELEKMGKENRMADAASALAALEARVARLLPGLRKYVQESDPLNESK